MIRIGLRRRLKTIRGLYEEINLNFTYVAIKSPMTGEYLVFPTKMLVKQWNLECDMQYSKGII